MQATPEGILEAIASEVSVDPVKLVPSATLVSLDISSLDLVSALFAVGDRFGVEVQPEDVASATTLQDLIDAVMAKSATA